MWKPLCACCDIIATLRRTNPSQNSSLSGSQVSFGEGGLCQGRPSATYPSENSQGLLGIGERCLASFQARHRKGTILFKIHIRLKERPVSSGYGAQKRNISEVLSDHSLSS